MTIAIYTLLGIQSICWILFLFGDIGFDHPGKYGLDFSDFVVISAVYAIALVSGIVTGLLKRRWFISSAQLLPILSTLLYFSLPGQIYNPADYQELVGKPKVEVEKRIGHPRDAITGLMSDDKHKNVEFINLRGMAIYISSNGIIESIEASDR